MEMLSMREVIISIKSAKEQHHLSIQDIMKLANDAGFYPSETTLRRLFADGSEDLDSFNYEQTIRPIARVLVDNVPETDSVQIYRQVCLYKHAKIDELQAQMEAQKEDYERKIAFLKEQLAIKDQRLDKLIDKLLEKL